MNDTLPEEVTTLIRPRRTHKEVEMTPKTKASLEYLRTKTLTADTSQGNAIVSNLKETVRLHQNDHPKPTVKPSSVEPINIEDAFHHYRGNYKGGAH